MDYPSIEVSVPRALRRQTPALFGRFFRQVQAELRKVEGPRGGADF